MKLIYLTKLYRVCIHVYIEDGDAAAVPSAVLQPADVPYYLNCYAATVGTVCLIGLFDDSRKGRISNEKHTIQETDCMSSAGDCPGLCMTAPGASDSRQGYKKPDGGDRYAV